MDRIKIFICYSSLDGKLSGIIYDQFEKYCGYKVFLAHEELQPSDDWSEEILVNLKETDYVIPIISKNFFGSSFANQEIGLALAYLKKIIPISIDGSDPKGFIDKKQAYKCHNSSEEELFRAVAVIEWLPIEHPKFLSFKERNIESLIYAFEHSMHWHTTSIVIDSLIQFGSHIKFTKSQLDRICQAFKKNYQIYGANWVTPRLIYWLKKDYGISV